MDAPLSTGGVHERRWSSPAWVRGRGSRRASSRTCGRAASGAWRRSSGSSGSASTPGPVLTGWSPSRTGTRPGDRNRSAPRGGIAERATSAGGWRRPADGFHVAVRKPSPSPLRHPLVVGQASLDSQPVSLGVATPAAGRPGRIPGSYPHRAALWVPDSRGAQGGTLLP